MHTLAFAESIQLFPDGTLFIHIALILLMIWVLNRTLFRPINAIIESREKQKGHGGSEAASILKDVDAKEAVPIGLLDRVVCFSADRIPIAALLTSASMRPSLAACASRFVSDAASAMSV